MKTMFCTGCGKKLKEDSKFCKYCGIKVGEEINAENEKDQDPPFNVEERQEEPFEIDQANIDENANEQNQYLGDDFLFDEGKLALAVGKNAGYYRNQFKKLQNEQKAGFNWIAFFFGPLLTLYRRCFRYFVTNWFPVYAAQIILIIIATILFSSAISSSASLNIDSLLKMGSAIMVAEIAVSIWAIVINIRAGLKFNSYYMAFLKKKVEEEDFPPRTAKASIKYPIMLIAVSLIVGIAFSSLMTIGINKAMAGDSGTGTMSESQLDNADVNAIAPSNTADEGNVASTQDEVVPDKMIFEWDGTDYYDENFGYMSAFFRQFFEEYEEDPYSDEGYVVYGLGRDSHRYKLVLMDGEYGYELEYIAVSEADAYSGEAFEGSDAVAYLYNVWYNMY